MWRTKKQSSISQLLFKFWKPIFALRSYPKEKPNRSERKKPISCLCCKKRWWLKTNSTETRIKTFLLIRDPLRKSKNRSWKPIKIIGKKNFHCPLPNAKETVEVFLFIWSGELSQCCFPESLITAWKYSTIICHYPTLPAGRQVFNNGSVCQSD